MWNNLTTSWFAFLIPGYSLAGTLLACAVLVFLSAWYSGVETGLYRMNRLRLHLACREKNRAAMILDRLLDNQQFLISVFLVGNNVVNYLLTSIITVYFHRLDLSTRQIELYTTAILTPIIFVFAETVPKMCFYSRANTLMLHSARFINVSSWLFRVTGLGLIVGRFSQLAIALANRFTRTGEMTTRDWDDLGVLLRENLIAGPLSKIQGGLAEQLLQLPYIRLARVLTPLQNVFALPHNISRDEFIQQLRDKPFARVPLYQGLPENIVGVVSIYEVFAGNSDQPPKSFIQPVLRIGADENVLSALSLMRESALRLALVVDKKDKVLGIITINDLLDEIMAGLE
jgi:CBS domain containing-hemolysin-like protein